MDTDSILRSVKKTQCVVTAEEHQMAGGLGESVASVLAQYHLAPLEMVAVKDSFGESGTPDQLLEKYGLMPKDIIAAAEKVLVRK